MMGSGERLLLVLTPVLTMAAVALGLRVGAGDAVQAALVYAAPASGAGTGLAWQVLAFAENRGAREPLSQVPIDVTARAEDGRGEGRWSGATNDDGAAEVLLALPWANGLTLEVRSGRLLLAGGSARLAGGGQRPAPASAWARFARREGAIALDVAVLGQRVASGFPASIWVRATDPASHRPLAAVRIEAERDASLSSAAGPALTDSRGWASIVATPMGHAVALLLHARSADGRTGNWAGALFVSPGAAALGALARYPPDAQPELDVVVPSVRSTAYVEIDDSRGRSWATAIPLTTRSGSMPRASVRAPRLAPGLYWAVAASDPGGAAELGPGTIVRPFFVAASDEAALSFGTDKEECTPPRDPRDMPRVVDLCLALAGATAVPRWIALDGFLAKHAHDAQKRARGLAIALGAIGIAIGLETILLVRTARQARARLWAAEREADAAQPSRVDRAANVGIAILVALLGFALLAALLLRAA
jgi:hypothetical protein